MPHDPTDSAEAIAFCHKVACAAWAKACEVSPRFWKRVMSDDETLGESVFCSAGFPANFY
jgi:hypothetical protein